MRQRNAPVPYSTAALDYLARGVRVSTPGEILRELRLAIDQPAVTVIHVPIIGGNPG